LDFPVLKIGSLIPRYPIIQGGMAVRLSTFRLAAAVANAGGIGTIAASGMDVKELKCEILNARKESRGIIGINIMFAVSRFKEMVYAALEEGIDLVIQGAGFSRDIFKWCDEAKTPVVPIVSSSKLAMIAESLGASAVVVEGSEAGGHLGTDRSMQVIVPEIKKEISIPVIAAGGIVDVGDLRKVFNLGADGVQMGIRFAASCEANGAQTLKELYVRSKHSDIVLVDSPVGLKGRAIKNKFTEKIVTGKVNSKENCECCLKKCKGNFCIMEALNNAQKGNLDDGLVFSGENIDKITEILPVSKIMADLTEGYAAL